MNHQSWLHRPSTKSNVHNAKYSNHQESKDSITSSIAGESIAFVFNCATGQQKWAFQNAKTGALQDKKHHAIVKAV